MKIMKVVDKKVGKTIYYKYRINLPVKEIENSKLLNKDLNVKVEIDRIVIETN